MKETVLLLASALILGACSQVNQTVEKSSDEQRLQQDRATARELVKQFAGTLKPELIAAMSQGGPVKAIKVCATRAPAIASELSQSSGWEITRVSLKARNQQTALPDEWEEQALIAFNELAANNMPASQLYQEKWEDGEYRFMQAQPAGQLCLHCHGSNISPSIKQALAKHYPGDAATGYKLGEIRGAFSLTKPASD